MSLSSILTKYKTYDIAMFVCHLSILAKFWHNDNLDNFCYDRKTILSMILNYLLLFINPFVETQNDITMSPLFIIVLVFAIRDCMSKVCGSYFLDIRRITFCSIWGQ